MRNFEKPGRSPVMSTQGMVATSHPMSSRVAIEVLEQGGNAMDAAVAACAVQCVVEPGSTGIGGDCFALYSSAGSGDVVAFNGSGRAPAAATLDWYHERSFESIERQSAHAVTVPGAVDAWERLTHDCGTRGLDELLQPAIALARGGYAVSPRAHLDWTEMSAILRADPGSRELLLVDDAPPPLGSRHFQPRLASTLEEIASNGARAFYEGEIAETLVAFLQRRGGLHTADDFAARGGEYVRPICNSFRDFEVWECPPNGQGAIALMILNVLAQQPVDGDPLTIDRIHLEVETTRLAYNERNFYVGDPQDQEIPIDWLLSVDHATELANRIGWARGALPERPIPVTDSTVYIAVVDRDCNAASFINSLFTPYGTGFTEPRTGVLLHNRGQSFNLEPGHPNALGPRKRPMHTLIPGMLTRNGRVQMPFGVMGGHYQALGQAQFLTRLLDYDCDLQEAMDLPRFFPRLGTGEVELESGIDRAVAQGLRDRGHETAPTVGPIGGAQAVWIDWKEGVLTGASDPRKDGCALGY